MRIALIGPPGSGKSTIASLLSSENNVPRFSCGDFIRGANDKYPWVKSIIGDYDVNSGKLADPLAVCEIMFKAIDLELAQTTQNSKPLSYILDGSPRTGYEAERYLSLPTHVAPSLYVIFSTDSEVCIARLSTRYLHRPSGRTYNAKCPPKVHMVDDVTGEPLEVRGDDDPDRIQVRLDQYKELTYEAIYQILSRVNTSTSSAINSNFDVLEINDDGSMPPREISVHISRLSRLSKELEVLRRMYVGHWFIRMYIKDGLATYKVTSIRKTIRDLPLLNPLDAL